MNTKNLFTLMMFVFSVILVSCEKNEMDGNSVIRDYRVQNILYAKSSKLKNISYVESIKSMKGGIIITQYEYDEQGRISKASQPMYKDGTPIFENGTIVGLYSYSDYVYNNDGLLEKIIYYSSNLYEGFINLQTSTYSYDKDRNKRKEVIVYPRALPFRTDSTIYYYDNNRLKREDKYEDGYFGSEPWRSKLTAYIEYEYDNQGQLIKENNYSGTDSTLLSYSIHYYQNGLNVKTETFIYYNIIGKTKLREIRRYYDENDNLIYLESEELSPLSSATSYVTKYEYY
ncbi:MAG: hypothetical protein FWD60_13305 [Candidatus Azobacteroides sp.]|nr:hypothetical protein [Candidatus Azobacteroides sp.]